MDVLRAEIAAKKRRKDAQSVQEKTVESETSLNGTAAFKERHGQEGSAGKKQKTDEAGAHSSSGGSKNGEGVASASSVAANMSESDRAAQKADEQKEGSFAISNEESMRRLRAKGEPIRLFGESDKERRLRLRALELIEQKGEFMGQNDFLRAMKGAESSMLNRDLAAPESGVVGESGSNRMVDDGEDGKASGSNSSANREGVGMDSLLDLSLIKRDINKVYPIIYYTLKGLVRDWEQTLAERPADIRQSNQGKLVAATQVQTADYLKPLFKQLRHRSVKPDVLARLAEIVHYVQKREYRHANDAYLQLSIGNAPWPIGVTMVGIHERSGREKIYSSNVAHVLNDEVSRKYIQSLKRLMTFAQTKYPPANVSMLMG